MICVGIDDTDTVDSAGTNQVARAVAAALSEGWRCVRIVRHQLLFDPRVPYTSKNSAASLLFEPLAAADMHKLTAEMRTELLQRFVQGSDPGLCVAAEVPDEVIEFGHRCQNHVVEQSAAFELASRHQIHLEGLGGTNDGVIGALSAVGLAAAGNDGRVVQIGGFPDDLGGPQPVDRLRERGVIVISGDSRQRVERGVVQLGKKLRPNMRGGRITLFANPADPSDGFDWIAEKRP